LSYAALTQEADNKAEEIALPLGKQRILPDWMVGAGKRVGVGQKKKKEQRPVIVDVPVKVKARVTAPKSATKTKAKR